MSKPHRKEGRRLGAPLERCLVTGDRCTNSLQLIAQHLWHHLLQRLQGAQASHAGHGAALVAGHHELRLKVPLSVLQKVNAKRLSNDKKTIEHQLKIIENH